MDYLIFGQPGTGKTTLAKAIVEKQPKTIMIDGDDLRAVTTNSAYNREGRIKNVGNAFMIAKFLNSQGFNIVLSIMAPYKEMRDVIAKKMPGIQMVYLYYDPSKITNIPRKEYWVSDFEEPNLQEHSICFQDTGKKTIAETLAWILPLGIINRKEIEVKIRFNREHKGAEFWRVIYGNKEHLADDVQVQVPMHATHDEIEPGIIKSHFTCLATDIQWNEKNVLIK